MPETPYDKTFPDWPSVRFQRLMLADMQRECPIAERPGKGLLGPSGRDPATGQPWTMGEHFDRHALGLLVCWEVEQRAQRA